MTIFPMALLAAAQLAHAHSPAGAQEMPPEPVPTGAFLAGPLPSEVVFKAGNWTADGHEITGDEDEKSAALMKVLSAAEGNEARVERARRRDVQAFSLAVGGLGFESAGLVIAVAAATGVVGVAAGPALALPIGLAGAGVGITGATIGLTNPPLRRAVRHYNAWAAAHPDALNRPVDPTVVEAAQSWEAAPSAPEAGP
jgi:hypothetical protein